MLLKDLSLNIERFSSTLSLKPQDISKRVQVCERIHKALKEFYPECQLFIYGSTLNGYGTRESDLDLLFKPFPEYHAESHNKAGNKEDNDDKKETQKSPTIYEITSGAVAKEELLHMDRQMQLCFVRRVLKRDKTFRMVMLIPARCPIVNFKIPYLKISCDISCGSSHVVCNTQLLRFYNQIDSRLQPLVIALRHWGKSLGFILSGLLSSYAFTLLVIFFLQNVDPPVLPPVKHLQELSEMPIMDDGWNIAFTPDPHKVQKSKNTKSVGELFREFFCFCGEFDFSAYVVSPNTGKSLPIKQLLETTDSRMKEFEITPMCIQDPFLLSFNTSRNFKMNLLYFFKQAAFLALKIIDGPELYYNFELLFNREEYTKLCKKCFNPPMSGKSLSFPINFNLSDTLKVTALNKMRFYEAACDALLELLQYGLLIDCEVINTSEISLGTTSMDLNKDNYFQFLMCIQCAFYNRTFIGRAQLKDKELPPFDCDAKQFDNTVIQNEYITSNYLIQQNPLLTSPQPFFWFYCDVYLNSLGNLENLIIVLTPLTESKERKTIFNFLKKFLEKNLLNVLSDSGDVYLNGKMDTSQ